MAGICRVFAYPSKTSDPEVYSKIEIELMGLVLNKSCNTVIIDLSAIRTLASWDLGLLVRAQREAMPRGISIVVANLSKQNRTLFSFLHFDQTFPVYNSTEDAISSLCVSADPKSIKSIKPLPYSVGDSIGPEREIVGILSRGGFGVVYLVKNHALGGDLTTVKTLRDEFLEAVDVRHRFSREARLWRGLGQHPNIVGVLSVFDFAGRPYVEMEYIGPDYDGRVTLRDHLKSTATIPLNTALGWAKQFCTGMAHAQVQGLICHRDVKPENLLMDKWEVIEGASRSFSAHVRVLRISDFGLAKGLDHVSAITTDESLISTASTLVLSSATHGGCGTPAYMPPEQFFNAARADIRSDIYSFGIVLYELAERRHPFDSPNCPSIDRQNFWNSMFTLQTSYRPDPVETPLWSIISKCIEKRPEDRFQSIGALGDALEELSRHIGGN